MFENSFVSTVRFANVVGPHPSNSLQLLEMLIKKGFPSVANSFLDFMFSKGFFKCVVVS
jgi:hypothetical protein